jgi:plastocyanin
MMRRMLVVLAFWAVAGTVRVTDAAVTDPDLSYTGSSCQPWGIHNQATSQNWFYTYGRAENRNSSTATLVCPAAKKDPEAMNGTSFAPMWIYNQTANVGFTCTLIAMDVNGNAIGTQAMTTYYAGYQALYFTGPNYYMASFEWGSWTYYCSVPPNSSVRGYMVVEQP